MEKSKIQKKNEPKKKKENKEIIKDELKDNKIRDNLKKVSKTFIHNEAKLESKTITLSGKTSIITNKKKNKEKENKNVNFNLEKNKQIIIHKRSESFQIKTNIIKDSSKENSKSVNKNKNSSKNTSKSNTKKTSKINSIKTSKNTSKNNLKDLSINKNDNEKDDKNEKKYNNSSQFKNKSNNIIKKTNKENKSNLNTEENIQNNNNNNRNSNYKHITTDNNNENVLFSIKELNLTETLNIISDIQMQFENSLKENKTPIEEIKKLIHNNINMNNYIPLSESQKNNIIDDIKKSSELRIKNYEMAFFYMKSSLDEIKFSLENIVKQEEEKNSENNNQIQYSNNNILESLSSSENVLENSNEIKNTNLTTEKDELNILKTYENENNNKKNKSKEKNIQRKLIEDTDFQEGIMLENALVIPPKSSGFNYQSVKDMTRTRSKRFCVKEHNNINNNDIINKEKNNLHIRNKSMNGNNINYIEIINTENLEFNTNDKNEKNTLSLTKAEIKSKEKIQNDCFIF